MTLAGMTKEQTNECNRNHCKSVADILDGIASGTYYKCMYCGHVIDSTDFEEDESYYDALTNGDECECPSCHRLDEFEQCDMWSWLEDALDLTYTINSDFSYRGGRVMVAWGGPSIYVDTMTGDVELFWWGDNARYPLSNDACAALDECLEELYELNRL